MLGQVWNERHLSYTHLKWFKNLLEHHSLTKKWLKDLESAGKVTSGRIDRITDPGLQREAERLEKWSHAVPADIVRDIIDETPKEFLFRIEHSVWVIQSWTLRMLVDSSHKEERQALKTLLERSSFEAGVTCSRERWPKLDLSARVDLRAVFSCVQDSPFSSYPRGGAFLVRRAIPNELDVELLACPHKSTYQEPREIADWLCPLHAEWLRGYVYAINSTALIQWNGPCRMSWSFYPGSPLSVGSFASSSRR